MSTLKADIQIQPQDLYAVSTTQATNLGALATTGDGRYFRYVKADASTAVVVGKLYQGPAEVTGWENLACAAFAIGDTQITTTSTITATVNQMAGGLLTVTASTGAGYTYKIKGNTAASGAVATIYLEDPILVAGTVTTSTVDIILNKYNGVVLWDAAAGTASVAGVSIFPIPVSNYGWLQVKGPTSVLVDAGALTVGQMAVASDDTDGTVGPYETDATTPLVGAAITGITAGDYGFVDLNIS